MGFVWAYLALASELIESVDALPLPRRDVSPWAQPVAKGDRGHAVVESSHEHVGLAFLEHVADAAHGLMGWRQQVAQLQRETCIFVSLK